MELCLNNVGNTGHSQLHLSVSESNIMERNSRVPSNREKQTSPVPRHSIAMVRFAVQEPFSCFFEHLAPTCALIADGYFPRTLLLWMVAALASHASCWRGL